MASASDAESPGGVFVTPAVKPKMGDIYEFAPWTGGKPKADWSGLNDSAADYPKTSNQLRATKACPKGHNHRRKGAINQFKPSDNITIFSRVVWKHFINTGMDSITYLQDPENGGNMLSVVTQPDCHKLKRARTLLAVQAPKYNK